MSKKKETLESRPFSLTEDDFNALHDCIKSLQLTSTLASEYNATAGGIPADLVSASLDLVSKRLETVLSSAGATFSL